jgi:hypothetical protein
MFSSTVSISLRKIEDLSDQLLSVLKSISYDELFTDVIARICNIEDVAQVSTTKDLVI